jgi:hypothetical protein
MSNRSSEIITKNYLFKDNKNLSFKNFNGQQDKNIKNIKYTTIENKINDELLSNCLGSI